MKNSQFQSNVSMEFDKYCRVLKPLIWTVTSAAYDGQFSKTSFGATTFIHSWSVHFALTEIQLQSISTKIIIICKDYQPSPESNTKNITIMKKIIIMFSMMGLASGRTTLLCKMLLWWHLPNNKNLEFSTCSDLTLGHQYLCKKQNKHGHTECNNYLQTKERNNIGQNNYYYCTIH